MSMIAKEVSTLDKLAWAIFPDNIKIARAAAILRAKSFSVLTLESDQLAKRELRLLVHATAPSKGKILAREEEIMDEVRRQEEVFNRRKEARPDPPQEPTYFRLAATYYRDYSNRRTRNHYKEKLMRDFGEKLGVERLNDFRRVGPTTLYFAGSWTGLGDVHVQPRRNGAIYRVSTKGGGVRATTEDAMAALVVGAIDEEMSVVLSEVVLKGAKLSADYVNMETILEYPDGRVVRHAWTTTVVTPGLDG